MFERKFPQLYDKAWLYEEYIKKDRTGRDIGAEVGCTSDAVSRVACKFGYYKRDGYTYPKLHDATWMRKKYLDEKLTCKAISDILGCDRSCVGDALKEHSIKRRTLSEEKMRERNPIFKHPLLYDHAWMYEQYIVKGRTQEEIGAELGCHNVNVSYGLKACGIKARTMKELWQDPKYISRVFKGLNAKPNKLERKVDKILQKLVPGEFRYNGDFSCGVVLAGLVPDFVNVNGRKILIEVFGANYHDEKVMKEKFKDTLNWKRTEFGRKAVYSQLGFDCIILWDYNLYKKDAEAHIASELRKYELME
ncbi:MAG: hypothetical protein U9N61_02140 [Euryarchaeota archaeon]|nr:hypothetical protein [Euryarchaeota archaeon]